MYYVQNELWFYIETYRQVAKPNKYVTLLYALINIHKFTPIVSITPIFALCKGRVPPLFNSSLYDRHSSSCRNEYLQCFHPFWLFQAMSNLSVSVQTMKASQLVLKMTSLVQRHFNLKSTVVTGIPMKVIFSTNLFLYSSKWRSNC